MIEEKLNELTYPQFITWINEYISDSYHVEIHSITDSERLVFLQNLWARDPKREDILMAKDTLFLLEMFLIVNFPQLNILDDLRLRVFYTLIRTDRLYMLETLSL